MQKFRLSSILLTQVILNYSQKKDDTSRVDDVSIARRGEYNFFSFLSFSFSEYPKENNIVGGQRSRYIVALFGRS